MDGVTFRFLVINLVMMGGGDGLLVSLNRVSGNLYHENPDFSILENPY